MTVTEAMLEEAKTYLRVDLESHEEDSLISGFIMAATKFIEKTTGKTYAVDDEVWNLAIRMLVTHWYENRGNETIGTSSSKISYAVDAMVSHIAMCGDYA